MRGTYYRWTQEESVAGRPGDTVLHADILGADVDIAAYPESGLISVKIPDRRMDADTARMIGALVITAVCSDDA